MKPSYNRVFLKPTLARKNPQATSGAGRQHGQLGAQAKEYAHRQYAQGKENVHKEGKGTTRRDRGSRNSNNSIYESNKNSNGLKSKNSSKLGSKQKQEARGNYGPHQPISLMGAKKSIRNMVQLREEPLEERVLETKINKKCFNYQYIIGKGGFGKVWKIEHTKNRNQYAMKQMLKSLVMTKKSVQSIMNERQLLSRLSSSFIVNMHYAFQDRDTLYLVLDLLDGGDLRHHISTKRFSEMQSKFIISCIILGLEYLHNNNIIHRDIKPENLVLDSRGYVRVTDLGIARLKKANNSSDTSGTPGYMSPEVICRQNHSFVSDFYALGVIAYELATGRRPHNGISRNQIREQILSKQASVRVSDIPSDWSQDCIDFINRLLQRKPEQRLGSNYGADELKNHPWIRDLNWGKLANRDIESPYVPIMRKSDFDQDEQITIEDQEQRDIIEKNAFLLRKPQFQQLFKDYYFESTGSVLTEKHRNSKVDLGNCKGVYIVSSKQPASASAKRKDSSSSYGQASIKNSTINLKKTNVSTNVSTEITAASLSGALKSVMKASDSSSRNISGKINRKSDAGINKENALNVSKCQPLTMGVSHHYREKESRDRPFFRS